MSSEPGRGVFRRAGGLIYVFLLLSCGIRLLMFQPCLDRILICLIFYLIFGLDILHITVSEIQSPPATYDGHVDIEEFWDAVAMDMISRGFYPSKF